MKKRYICIGTCGGVPVLFFELKGCAGKVGLGRKGVQRFMSVDPLAEKYPNVSPFVYVGNNPLIFIDPDGMELIFSFRNKKTRKKDKANLERFITEGLGGYGTASIDKKGMLSISLNGDISEASDEVKSFYNTVNEAIEAGDEVVIDVLNGDDYVVVGDFDEEAIDMRDMAAFENIDNNTGLPDATSVQGKLAHEIAEQTDKQFGGNEDFPSSHLGKGIPAEDGTTGTKRLEDLRNSNFSNAEIRPTAYEVNGVRVNVTVYQERERTYVKQRKSFKK